MVQQVRPTSQQREQAGTIVRRGEAVGIGRIRIKHPVTGQTESVIASDAFFQALEWVCQVAPTQAPAARPMVCA